MRRITYYYYWLFVFILTFEVVNIWYYIIQATIKYMVLFNHDIVILLYNKCTITFVNVIAN